MTPSSPRSASARALPLADLDRERVETRNLPFSPAGVEDVRAAGWTLDDLWLPAMVLQHEALEHNLRRFAGWCTERGMEHAPHGKTTMSPHLWSAQLEHGAWAITAATPAQARVMRRFGVPRVVLANEVVERAQVAWLGEASSDPDFDVFCLVDSHAGIEQMERALSGTSHRIQVLVELGVPGRRTGVRDVGDAVALAERAAESPHLQLAGVEGYEGVFPQERNGDAESTARAWVDRLLDLAGQVHARGLAGDRFVVTAGGSGYPDLVADAFAASSLPSSTTFVLRSGCYLTHDDVQYEISSPLRSAADSDPLQPALTCFARVLSAPEPGRVLLGVGKRETAFDTFLPVVRAARRDGERVPLADSARIVELNDHHGFCDFDTDGLLAVGDVVELGPSHPCTVFDKWPLLPVVDAGSRVVDAVRTIF